ncbi:MAG: hypothetical protein AABY15_06770 [Nanoarchaeota archaeon]
MDLFEHYDKLPQAVRDIISKYGEDWDETYENCRNMLLEVEAHGYTFDYYLDAEPYDLRRMVKVGEKYQLDELDTFFAERGCNIPDYALNDNGDHVSIQHKTEPNKSILLKLVEMKDGIKTYECIHTDVDVAVEEN